MFEKVRPSSSDRASTERPIVSSAEWSVVNTIIVRFISPKSAIFSKRRPTHLSTSVISAA